MLFFFACLLSLFPAFQNAGNHNAVKQNFSLASQTNLSFQHHQLHLPVNTISTPLDLEVPEEEEQEDDPDDEIDFLAEQPAPFSTYGPAVVGNRFIRSATAGYGHGVVPFFILYHSWKSFLS